MEQKLKTQTRSNDKDKKHTSEELKQWQSLPLGVKILMTKSRIRAWIKAYGEDGVYVSFSGGKDSTVLLDLVRQDYPDVSAVYIDTGLEYPELRNHVRTFENVTWLKPKMNFRDVIGKYGYPFISKEVSQAVYECRSTESNGKKSCRREQFNGTYVSKNGKKKKYSITKWKFLLDAPFKISHKCCYVFKKEPSKQYEKEMGKHAMLAQMAEESKLRRQMWMKDGCNGFNKKRPTSNPMAFWTEQDVLRYIKENNIEIASVYGDIVEDSDGKLHTTGCDRTGCVFCGYGCHLEKGKGKFERLKETHPKIYEYIMKPTKKGGLGYKTIIDWLNKHGDLNIRY